MDLFYKDCEHKQIISCEKCGNFKTLYLSKEYVKDRNRRILFWVIFGLYAPYFFTQLLFFLKVGFDFTQPSIWVFIGISIFAFILCVVLKWKQFSYEEKILSKTFSSAEYFLFYN